jgi:UDP-N-acetylmuramate dehydrogenase
MKYQYITSVVFKLTKRDHKINTSYGDITNELAKTTLSKFERRKQCCYCHSTKQITDPKELGNSGSFLKIQLLKTDFEKIHQQFPEMKYYDVSETEVKSLMVDRAGKGNALETLAFIKIKHWF